MKELLAVLSLLASGFAQPEAPYPPSGWRPNGPAFELPQKQPQNTQYLPPLDPRNPTLTPDDAGVSVQGLPTLEQQPIFQLSPINGQQYVGPAFNADIQTLDERLRQTQLQKQQDIAREFARQRALEGFQSENKNRVINPLQPRQFAATTDKTTQNTPTTPKYKADTTTELNLNEGEALNEKKNDKVDVEVTKQNVQEFPPELFLTPLTQKIQSQLIPLEQFAQLTAPLYFQQIQDGQNVNDPAFYAAAILSQRQILNQPGLDSQKPLYLAPKNQAADPVFIQTVNPQSVGQPPLNQASVFTQPQAAFNQQPALNQFGQQGFNQFVQTPNYQYQTQIPLNSQYEPIIQGVQTEENVQRETNNTDRDDKQSQGPQLVYQPVYQQPQNVYTQPQQVYQEPQQVYQQPQQAFQQPQEQQQIYQQPQQIYQQPQQINQQPQEQQLIYQQQQQIYQQPQQIYQQPQQINQQPQEPQLIYQQQQQIYQQPQQLYQEPQQVYQQPQQIYQSRVNQDQFLLAQAQLANQYNQFYQVGQSQIQGTQDSLQSGINVNQQGNDLDEEKVEQNEDTGVSAVATATAFGTRTQPRTFVRYGAPAPPSQDVPTTTESATEPTTEGPTIAEATAIANGRRKSAKLRNRRVRPVFTVDRSGHLILAQEQ